MGNLTINLILIIRKSMWIYGIFLLIMPFACRAMEPSSAMEIELPPYVMLKDANKKHIATLNPQEYEILSKLSPILRIRPKDPKEGGLIVPYGIVMELNEEQINALAQSLKSQDNFYRAAGKGLIDLNMTPEQLQEADVQLQALKLRPVSNLLVVRTQDGYVLGVPKNMFTDSLKTVEDLVKAFSTNLVIMLNIKKVKLIIVYELLKYLLDAKTPAEQLEKTEKFIQDKKLDADGLKNLLINLDYLYFDNEYALAALIEHYESLISPVAWEAIKNTHPLIKKLAPFAHNLKELRKVSVTGDGTIVFAVIEGPEVTSLKGIQIIKYIDKAELLFVINTNIDKIEADSLKYLPRIKKLAFMSNKNLTTLEKRCLQSPQLTALLFHQNNIAELPADVFDLPSLVNLTFAYNNLQVIKANWAIGLPNLRNFYLIEPTLKVMEKGWLNNVGTFTLFSYSEIQYKGEEVSTKPPFFEIVKKGLLPGQKLSVDEIGTTYKHLFDSTMSTRPLNRFIFEGLFPIKMIPTTVTG